MKSLSLSLMLFLTPAMATDDLPATVVCNKTKTKCFLVIKDGDRFLRIDLPLGYVCNWGSA